MTTAQYQGVTTPLPDIIRQIEAHGWELKHVKLTGGKYEARATNPHGEQVDRFGPTDATAAANVLLDIIRTHRLRSAAQHYGGMWNATWTDKLAEIAEAYSKAPVYDPKAAAAWRELARDSVARAKVLGEQLNIKVVPDPEPYASSQEMSEDIHKNKKFLVSNANSQHPIWTVEENVAFRTVHDVLGHAVSGGDFGWHGENLACAAHFPLLSPVAQQALFTECIGQTAYAAHYRSFGPQKVALLDDFLQPAQQQENPPAHTGIHPAESIAPTAMPAVAPSEEPPGILPEHTVAPHMEGLGLTPVMAKYAMTIMDPNQGFQSGHAPEPGKSAFHDMSITHPDGRMSDPLDSENVMENAGLIDTKWNSLTKEDGTPDHDKMRLAIVNAFRVVLLSPRKDLRWNAVHYQDVANVPWDETDPKVYWDTLEKARQTHNVKHYGEGTRFAHLEHYKYLPKFKAVLQAHYPHLHHDKLGGLAEEVMWEWFEQEQSQILAQDSMKHPDKQMSGDDVERKANKAMKARMEAYVKDSAPGLDWEHTETVTPDQQQVREIAERTSSDQMGFDIDVPEEKVAKPGKYGAFMGTHLKAIAKISEHADNILKAAQEDVQKHDAAGHHFRAYVLQLGVSGVGPKVCSFAWLILQPLTSQLGTIDTHMMDVLGHNYEKDMNNRDYFKFERELAAGRDASGYSHVPLGAFQWGMWDYKRTGPGSHQDHSAMAALDPKHHEAIDWEAKADNLKGEAWAKQGPWWWKNTQEARDHTAAEFDATMQVPQSEIPFQRAAQNKAMKIAAEQYGTRPWIVYEGTLYLGEPQQTYAQFLRRSLNVAAHEFFSQTGHSLGRFDPKSNGIVTVEGTPPSIDELRALLT